MALFPSSSGFVIANGRQLSPKLPLPSYAMLIAVCYYFSLSNMSLRMAADGIDVGSVLKYGCILL
jgi:hypothetical protein